MKETVVHPDNLKRRKWPRDFPLMVHAWANVGKWSAMLKNRWGVGQRIIGVGLTVIND